MRLVWARWQTISGPDEPPWLMGRNGRRRIGVHGSARWKPGVERSAGGLRSDGRSVNRRKFLELAGLGTLGSMAPRMTEARQLGRIGLQLYTVRKLMEANVRATLESVANVGYKEV